jgi:hypothetical protein
MATFNNTPSIVTNGLILCVDAFNLISYQSGSSTWNNLAGSTNITLVNTPGFTTNPNTLVFDGVDDHGTLSRIISSDFSISCWFKTTQNSGGTGAWYSGPGLVDAEVSGFVNDFGLSMGAGQLLFGTGNPDVTIRSGTTYNDNIWHMVTATRKQSTGALNLYVDGILKASGTGNTNKLTSPGNITIGCLRPLAGFFAGSIACISFYNKDLSSSEIQQNYNALRRRFGI